MSDKSEIIDLISEYNVHKALTKATLSNNPYHTFREDLTRIIESCDAKISDLKEKLEELEVLKDKND